MFWAFRIMVGIGLLMLAVSWWTTYALVRKKDLNILTTRILGAMTFSGWVALVAGWYVTEIGRQPWLVYGACGLDCIYFGHVLRCRCAHKRLAAGVILLGRLGQYVDFLTMQIRHGPKHGVFQDQN